jgi:hypothetical protein
VPSGLLCTSHLLLRTLPAVSNIPQEKTCETWKRAQIATKRKADTEQMSLKDDMDVFAEWTVDRLVSVPAKRLEKMASHIAEAIDKQKEAVILAAIKRSVVEKGYSIHDTYDDPIEGLAQVTLQVKCRAKTHDKRYHSDIAITELADDVDQDPWYNDLEYQYKWKCRDADDYDEKMEDGWEGDWDDPDSGTVLRNVTLYCQQAPKQCPPSGTTFKAIDEDYQGIDEWQIRENGLYLMSNSDGRVKKPMKYSKSDWPDMEWLIITPDNAVSTHE